MLALALLDPDVDDANAVLVDVLVLVALVVRHADAVGLGFVEGGSTQLVLGRRQGYVARAWLEVVLLRVRLQQQCNMFQGRLYLGCTPVRRGVGNVVLRGRGASWAAYPAPWPWRSAQRYSRAVRAKLKALKARLRLTAPR